MDEIPHEMKQKQTSRTIAPLQRPVLLVEANQREDSPDDIPSSLVGKYYSVRVTDKVKSAQAIGSVQIDIEEKAILHRNLGRILFAFSFFFFRCATNNRRAKQTSRTLFKFDNFISPNLERRFAWRFAINRTFYCPQKCPILRVRN